MRDLGLWQDLTTGEYVLLLWNEGKLYALSQGEWQLVGHYPYAAIAALETGGRGFVFARWEKVSSPEPPAP